jgi:hypothetical protein
VGSSYYHHLLPPLSAELLSSVTTITAGAPTIRGNSVRDYYHHYLAGGGLTNDVASFRRLDRATLEKSENSSANVEKMAYKMAYRNKKCAVRRILIGVLAEAVRFELTEGSHLRRFSRPLD